MTRSLAKGLIAGLIGGLVGTAAKTIAEKVFPPRTHGEPEPPDVVVEKMGGGELSANWRRKLRARRSTGPLGRWLAQLMVGLVEYYPAASSKEGASFGIALATLTHEGALPALGLAAAPEDQTEREHTSEMTSHVVFGVVTEIVRGIGSEDAVGTVLA